MGIRLNDIKDDKLRARILSADNQASSKVAIVEPTSGDGALAKKETPRCNGQVDIRIHSRLKRLRDSDGTSGKYAIDGLVSCGILRGDGPEVVREVSHSQEQAEKDETIITITEVT